MNLIIRMWLSGQSRIIPKNRTLLSGILKTDTARIAATGIRQQRSMIKRWVFFMGSPPGLTE
jgi:hypothetical protein